MTFLEKYNEEHPNANASFYTLGCPSRYGYPSREKEGCNGTCEECWNREMPSEELKKIGEAMDRFVAPLKGYNEGLNDAWELAKKFFADMKDSELEEIFGKHWSFPKIMAFTPQEALAKMKAYEESQKIEVGDIVDVYGDIGVVSSLGTDKDRYHVLFNDGITNIYGKTIPIKKTGKHIDISSILEQIGEQRGNEDD